MRLRGEPLNVRDEPHAPTQGSRDATLLQMGLELIGRQTCHLGNMPHREGVYHGMSWDLQHHRAVTHRDVLALPDDPIPQFFQNPYRVALTNAGNLWHGGKSDKNLFAHHALNPRIRH